MSKTELTYNTDKDALEEARRLLAAFSRSNYSADQGVAYHTDPPSKISLPVGMTPEKGSVVLSDVATAQAQQEQFIHKFNYRPWDGAYALRQVMIKHFGTTGRGKAQVSFFGSTPPQQIEIKVGVNETVQIPWGQIEFAPLEGTLETGGTVDAEFGTLFVLSITCPKRYAASVHGLFNLIEMELAENSIYRGKAFRGTEDPTFIEVSDTPDIVYTHEVEAGLTQTVWGVIEDADLFLEDGRRINKRTLLFGPYGTGKSEAGRKTAKVATDNGWTFIQFHSGKSDLEELEKTVATARLYQPSVVFIEDIDVYAANPGENYQSRLSNLFDGINTKQDKVMIVMTSNRAADFSKGMMRAGRVDRMIEVGPLDRDATERLIIKVVGEHRLGLVDYDRVWAALEGFEPAFVRQTFDQAAEAAIIRTHSLEYMLSTEDFVNAANLLRAQHEMHANKSDSRKVPTLDGLFKELVEGVVLDRIEFSNSDIGQIETTKVAID